MSAARRFLGPLNVLLPVLVLVVAVGASLAHALEVVIDFSELDVPKNAEVVICLNHLRRLGYPVCFESKTTTVRLGKKTDRKDLRIKADGVREALDSICWEFPDYAWESTAEGRYVIKLREGSVLDLEVEIAKDVSGTAGQLIKTYLVPHDIHLSHWGQPRSEADGLAARLPKGKYRIGEFLFAVLESDSDLLWYIDGIHGRRWVHVSRLSWSVSYWRNVKPQEDARLARQRLRTGKTSLGKAVTFVDPGLEKAILEALGKPAGPIFEAELAAIDDLDASAKNIKNLAGLGRLPNLIWLNLSTNRISNLAPLGACKKLLKLGLSSNEISDVTPLKELDRLSILHLTRNRVSDVGPLGEMRSLERLGLNYNQIVDIAPLVKNAEAGGLGDGDIVWLHFNPLGKDSVDKHLPRLRELGVDIRYELGAGIDPHTGIGLLPDTALENTTAEVDIGSAVADDTAQTQPDRSSAQTDGEWARPAASPSPIRPTSEAGPRSDGQHVLTLLAVCGLIGLCVAVAAMYLRSRHRIPKTLDPGRFRDSH